MSFIVSGTGKTMVMDMFYSYVETEKKKRVHFHGFMLDVHKSEYTSMFVTRMLRCKAPFKAIRWQISQR